MTNKINLLIILLGTFVAVGCSTQKNTAYVFKPAPEIPARDVTVWHPDTTNLDLSALDSPANASLDHDVKLFYELLHKKDWKAAYEMRWKTYRQDFPEKLYLDLAQQDGARWELANYEVLDIQVYKLENNYDATLICKFTEMPGPVISYAAVYWHQEKDGVWRCSGAGPRQMRIFHETRYNPTQVDE